MLSLSLIRSNLAPTSMATNALGFDLRVENMAEIAVHSHEACQRLIKSISHWCYSGVRGNRSALLGTKQTHLDLCPAFILSHIEGTTFCRKLGEFPPTHSQSDFLSPGITPRHYRPDHRQIHLTILVRRLRTWSRPYPRSFLSCPHPNQEP